MLRLRPSFLLHLQRSKRTLALQPKTEDPEREAWVMQYRMWYGQYMQWYNNQRALQGLPPIPESITSQTSQYVPYLDEHNQPHLSKASTLRSKIDSFFSRFGLLIFLAVVLFWLFPVSFEIRMMDADEWEQVEQEKGRNRSSKARNQKKSKSEDDD